MTTTGPATTAIVTTPRQIRSGDLLIAADGIQLSLDGVGLLVEASDLLDDATGEYAGVEMYTVTVWGARRMVEMRMDVGTSVTIRRGIEGGAR